MKNFTPWILVILFTLLTGCLPQEKVTQCGEGEAFSPSQRRCVASLGSTGNIVSIQSYTPAYPYTVYQGSASPTVHTVTIRDPYNQGFRTKWQLIKPDNSTLSLANNTLSYTLVPNSGYMTTLGTYTLQFTLLDITGTTPIDTRTWTIQVINVATPDIVSQTPGSPVVTKLTNNTSDLNFTINVSNPSLTPNSTEWYLDGVLIGTHVGGAATSSHTQNVTHAQLSLIKTYSLQAVVKSGGTTYDSTTWYITVTNPATPSVTGKSPDPAVVVSAVDTVSMQNNGFYTTASGVNTTVNDFCVTVSDQNGSDGTGVDIKFFKDGAPFPVSGIAANTVSAGSPTACVSDVPADPIVNLVNATIGETHIFSARVFDKGTGIELTSVLNPINWILSARPANETPIARIDRSNLASVPNEATCFTDATYTTLNTTANSSSINFCRVTQDIDTTFTFQVYDSDYPLTYLTSSSPLPSAVTNLDKYKVDYYLNGQLLDGTHPLSDTDCTFDYSEGNVISPGSSKFSCAINFRSYTSSGPLSVSGLSYTVTAKVTDSRMWPTPGTPGVESGIQTWQVTKVNESVLGAPEVASQISAPTTGSPLEEDESAIFLNSDLLNILPATGAAVVSENQTLAFSLALGDDERDNGVVTVTRCTGDPSVLGICTAAETPVSASLSRVNGNRWARKLVPYTLKDNAVVGASEAIVYFQVTFNEVNDTAPAAAAVVNMQVPVINVNPAPVLQAPASTLPDPTGGPYLAFTGFPFTIDPGAITDSNQYDGNVIEYQWRYSTDGTTWTNIEGAEERLLVWTPPRNLGFDALSPGVPANVFIQLCVGDNGFGNDVNTPGEETCTSDEAIPYNWNLNVYNSAVNLGSNDLASTLLSDGPGVDKAVWLDADSSIPVNYTAYATSNTSGTSGYIILEKTIYHPDAAQGGSLFNVSSSSEARSVIFRAYPSHSNCRPRDISITGHNDGVKTDLYVSYICKDLDNKDKLNIRHVKVINNKPNMAHPGTFGFDYDGPTVGSELIVSPNMSVAVSSQKSVITVGAVNPGDTVQFNYTSSPLTITVGTDICNPSCATTTAMATELTDFINNSTDLNLQGFVATSATNQVTLDGTITGDYHVLDSQVYHAGKIQIVEFGGTAYWYVPYLNSLGLSATHQNKVSMILGAVGNLNISDYSGIGTALLSGTSQSVEIDNDINSDDQGIVIAVKSTLGRVNVYHYSLTTPPPSTLSFNLEGSLQNIFASQVTQDIKVAVNYPGNTHSIDVAARYSVDASVAAADQGKLAIYHIGENLGTYDLAGATPGSLTSLDSYGGTTLTSETLSGSSIELNEFADFRIATTPGQDELVLLFSTNRNNATPNEVYIGKVYFDGMLNPILTCATESYAVCAPLSQGYTGGAVRDKLTISSDDVYDKLALSKVKSLTLGNDGAESLESTRAVITTAYSLDNTSNGAADIESQIFLQQNVINVSDENISTDGPDYSGLPYILERP